MRGSLLRDNGNKFSSKKIIAITVLSVSLFSFYVLNIFPFLAVNRPVNGEIMVVEGWIPSITLSDVVDSFNKGTYKWIITAGGPSTGEHADRKEGTLAYQCKQELVALGIPAEKIIALPEMQRKYHKTYSSALELKDWLSASGLSVKKIDIFTAGVHGRKSWILYRRALGKVFQVGIISSEKEKDISERWWTSKRGIYLVIRNTVGYFDALLFTF